MDNSSRNIVKFIAALTFAALLIMAARNYAESQNTEKPTEVAEKAATPATLPAKIGEEAITDPDPQDQAEEIVEEDAEISMGEPSINLEQGGATDDPPAQLEPQAELQPEQ